MNLKNPYSAFVSEFERLVKESNRLPLGGFAGEPKPVPAQDQPIILIFSPHPDDECIIGALPLRLLRQAKMRVINVAVTQGSRKDRQAARYQELQHACRFIGYELIPTAPNGLEAVNLKTRQQNPDLWSKSVRVIATILAERQPKIIFFPHPHDWNSTHIGTHYLVVDALRTMDRGFDCFAVETEYWGAMDNPNLMVESSPQEVADMVAGISFHVGEVQRNPFHIRLPAWMQDNVRRGAELVGGQGQTAPTFVFATLYRLRRWRHGRFERALQTAKSVPVSEDPKPLFI